MEDQKQETQGGGWMSVPAFGDWDMKNGVPDYSMDFSKIREMRKQSKSDFGRASIGNEEELVRKAGDGGGRDRRRDNYTQLPDNSIDTAPAHSPHAMNFITEAQFRLFEVEQQRAGFLAFKDMYDEATSDNKELKGLLDNIDGHSVPKLITAIKSKDEALEFEKKMNSLHVEEINNLNQQLITSNDKLGKAVTELKTKDSELLNKAAELLDKDSELEKKNAELEEKVAALQKSCSDLEASAKELQVEKDKAASDRQRLKKLRAKNINLLADKKKLQSELESAKAEGSSRAIPDEVINAFEKGFNSCQKLIKKKFPEAGVDYSELNIAEVSESEAEEEDGGDGSEEE